MPYATLYLTGDTPTAELQIDLQARTTAILVDALAAEPRLVAVRVVVDPPAAWSVGGVALAPGASGVLATICLAESSADDSRIAAAVTALAAMLRATLGVNALPPYVVVERIGDALWAYKGRTLAQLRQPPAT